MKNFIVLICVLGLTSQLLAQTAAEYNFTQSSAAYPAIPGTIVSSGIAAGSDEMLSASIPIGFNFVYCGTTYTSIKASSNGFINPGGTATQAAFNNDLAGATKPAIAPLWDDHAVGATGSIVYSTSGTIPNRVFTVEFRNIKWTYTATTENRSFQVRLYETTNIIEFYYNIIDAPVNNPAASIGISDATGGSGHFLSVTPAVNATVNSTTANNVVNNSLYLNGIMYQFSPANCPLPGSFQANGISHISANLSWYSSNITNMKYQTTPFNPLTGGILISGLTSPYLATGLSPNTNYYIYLQNDCGLTQSTWSGPFIFKTLCSPNSVFPYTENFENDVPPPCWTETVVTNTGNAPDWFYTTYGTNPTVLPFDGTAMAEFNAFNASSGSKARLETQILDLTGITSPIITYQMYHDISFDYTTSEGIQVQVTTNGTNWTNVGPFNVRYNPVLGWVEAMVDLSAYSGLTIRVGFLGISQFGNNMYIDNVYIGEIPSCLPPTSVTISDITAQSAQAQWQASSGNLEWNYEIGPPGFFPGTGTALQSGTSTGASQVISSLSQSTSYDFYVRSDCDTNGFSAWAGPYTFTTTCLPYTAFPMIEDFEHSGSLPVCWTVGHNPAGSSWFDWAMLVNDPNGAPTGYGGSGFFASLDCFNATVDGNPYYLKSRAVTIPGPFYKLSYYYWIGSLYSLQTPIIVSISADNGTTWTPVHSHDVSIVGSWAQNEISLGSYDQQTIIIRFEGYSDWGYGSNDLGIDQVEIYADKFLEYSGLSFQENLTNDGTIHDTIDIQLSSETFAVSGILSEGIHYTTSNMPAGLQAEIEIVDDHSARFTLTGTAINHENSFDIHNLGLEFKNAAFTGNNASSVYSYKVDTITVNFIDQLLINEVDADQTGSDVKEFIELYDGGVGNYSLDGYCVVLFNGNTDVVYGAYDLTGKTTNAEGYFVMGTPLITSATLNFPGNTIQNGQDAIAIYEGTATSFPSGSLVTTNGLIDAVVYDNGQADDPALLTLIEPGEPQVNENEYNMGPVYSFQRIPNGSGGMRHTYTFAVAPPTPGTINIPAPELLWPTDTFMESVANDGSIENTITLTLRNDIVLPTGTLLEATHYTANNIPSGLDFQLTVLNDTTIEVALTGYATEHLPINNISNLELLFTNSVFDSYTSDMIIYAKRYDIKVNFDDPVNTPLTSLSGFKFYPNPASESVKIVRTAPGKDDILKFYDVSGREITSHAFSGTETIVQTDQLSPGVYLLKLGSDQGILIISDK